MTSGIYLIGLIVYILMNPRSQYLTLMLRNLGFNPLNTNLLTIPSEAASILTLLAITLFSERVNERSFVSMFQNIWAPPCIIALRWWSGPEVDAWGTFALVTTLLSYPYYHAIVVAWASRNSGSVRTRSVAAAFYNMCVQLGNVVSANKHEADDAPLYHRGIDVLFALCLPAIALFVATKFYYIRRNNTRSAIWDAMNEPEKEHYINNMADEGNRRLDFCFVHRLSAKSTTNPELVHV